MAVVVADLSAKRVWKVPLPVTRHLEIAQAVNTALTRHTGYFHGAFPINDPCGLGSEQFLVGNSRSLIQTEFFAGDFYMPGHRISGAARAGPPLLLGRQ